MTLVPKLMHINPVYALPSNFKTHFNIILPSTLRSLKWFSSYRFSKKYLSAFLFSPFSYTYTVHWIPLEVIKQKYFMRNTNYETLQYKILSSLMSLPPTYFQQTEIKTVRSLTFLKRVTWRLLHVHRK
jgi:hypothetical protein